jgi:protein-disulfide isomerase/uncharacterized membrane protein
MSGTRMTSRSRSLLLAFALLGLGASAASSYVHYQLLTQPTYTSFCDMSATISCTQAYRSQYGSFAGVPVAILGVIFFAVALIMTAFAPKPRVVPAGKKVRAAEAAGVSGENVPAYIFALSTIGLAFTIYLAWASFFQLRSLCVLCVLTYVAVAGLFIISGGATSFPMTTLPKRAIGDASALAKSPVALLITILLVGGAVTAIAAFPREGSAAAAAEQESSRPFVPLTDGQRQEFEKWYDVQPVVDVPIEKDKAKVLVVKFNDYQCPPCRQTYFEYKNLLAKYVASGDVKFVLKHFPLEIECNPGGGAHQAACEAAAAVLMAEKKGSGPQLEQWLFLNQGPPQLTPDQVRRAAAEIGGVTDFDAQYATVLNQVKADAALGSLLGTKSTPTFFINGRRIAGGLPPAAFEAAIELELKRSR